MPDERPVVSGTVTGGHIMPAAEMRTCTVDRTGGCKPRDARVSSAPLTSINGLSRYSDFTW